MKYSTRVFDLYTRRLSLQADDAVYFFEGRSPQQPDLMRVRYPGKEKETFVKGCPEGWLSIDERGVHIIGKKWLLADVSTGALQTVVDKPAWFFSGQMAFGSGVNENFGVDLSKTSEIRAIYHTSHYGPVVMVRKERDEKLYRLNFTPSK